MENSAVDRILMFLKMRKETTSSLVAQELGITKEGARKHLINLAKKGLIESISKNEGIGRPTTYYILTSEGLAKFPDTHAQITVNLLQSVKKLLGDNALDLLISDREKQTYSYYENQLSQAKDIDKKLILLSKLRSEEGYMAEWNKDGDLYYFTENHCPICAAATECQGFCRAELHNFQQLFGVEYNVSRIQHIVSGGNRCTYKIEKA